MNRIYGYHAVLAQLRCRATRIKKIVLQKGRQDERVQAIKQLAGQHHIALSNYSRHDIERVLGKVNHQGIMAEIEPVAALTELDLAQLLNSLAHSPLLLILDCVQDPHNLGACFRLADAMAVDAIITPKDRSVGLTPVVHKVASGATNTIPFVQVTNLVRTMRELQQHGVWLYGADMSGSNSIYQQDFSGAIGLVMGAEGDGLRRLTREACDGLIHIPMHGSVESLNVAMSSAIILAEAQRQRS